MCTRVQRQKTAKALKIGIPPKISQFFKTALKPSLQGDQLTGSSFLQRDKLLWVSHLTFPFDQGTGDSSNGDWNLNWDRFTNIYQLTALAQLKGLESKVWWTLSDVFGNPRYTRVLQTWMDLWWQRSSVLYFSVFILQKMRNLRRGKSQVSTTYMFTHGSQHQD